MPKAGEKKVHQCVGCGHQHVSPKKAKCPQCGGNAFTSFFTKTIPGLAKKGIDGVTKFAKNAHRTMNDKVYQPAYRGLKTAHQFAKDNKLYSKATGAVLGALGAPGIVSAAATKGVEKLGGSKKKLTGGSKKAPRRKNPYSTDAKSNVARPIPRMSGDGVQRMPRLEMNARRFMKGNEKLNKGSAAGPAGNPSTAAQVAGLNTAMTGAGIYKAGCIISV